MNELMSMPTMNALIQDPHLPAKRRIFSRHSVIAGNEIISEEHNWYEILNTHLSTINRIRAS